MFYNNENCTPKRKISPCRPAIGDSIGQSLLRNAAAIFGENFKTSFPATGCAYRRKAVSTPSVSSLNASFQRADDTPALFNCQGSPRQKS
ncbi:MAG: hypothetical protein KDA36_10990, partial [Planctomycetaceae bacterium]|nr:hypothetical protein [Planctomycetaceae bacterium]